MNKSTVLGVLGVAVWMVTMAGARAASNTLVRFHFSHGSTAVGDVVVELFDEDKPVTVQNFLNYVRDGSYDNLVLYRCIPNFVIQAGILRVRDPMSATAYNGSDVNVNDGPITNEFGVGPLLSNTFGTLAMAKVGGDPNSAKLDWFINLTDNASLDTNNGGFTVFGRVISGTNVLNFFNHPGPSLGFIHGSSPFEDLPVAYNRNPQTYPRFRDLFNVQITPLDGPADTRRPTVKIDYPPAGIRLSNESITVTGTAADDAGIRTIWYRSGEVGFTNAVGTTNWSIDYRLIPGTNTIGVQSVDTKGRRSPFALRSMFWSVPQVIAIHTIGNGRVIGGTDGEVLEVNRRYLLTAVPASGHRFAGWEKSVLNDTNSLPEFDAQPRVIITMLTNLSLTASFVPNPFPPLKATYSGLFLNTNDALFIHPHFGVITLTVTDNGRVTGKVRMQGKAYPFSGTLAVNGFGDFQVPRLGQTPLRVEMTLDVTNRSEIIKGFVYDPNVSPDWSSPFAAVRVRPGTTANPSPYAGSYTVVFPGATNTPDSLPAGDGFGRITISTAGNLTFAGVLADGSPVTQGVPVTTNGVWPFYSSLYSGQGSVVASVTFDASQPDGDLSGATHGWFRPAQTKTSLFQGGFTFHGDVLGSRYRAPSNSTVRMLDFTNGIATFVNGNLIGPVTNNLELSANNVVLPFGLNELTLSLTKSSGLFSGKVTPPNSTQAIPFKGAVLQKQNFGAGYFLGTNQCGRVYFGPEPREP